MALLESGTIPSMALRGARKPPESARLGRPSYEAADTALCKILQAKLREFLQIFPKMADWQAKAGLSSLAALRRENSNMEESFYTTLYRDGKKGVSILLSNS